MGIRAQEEFDCKSRGNLAGRIMSVLRTKLGESLKEEKGCKRVLCGDWISRVDGGKRKYRDVNGIKGGLIQGMEA